MVPIFPSEIINFSTETLIKKHSNKSKIIYLILLVTFCVFAISLFFISVDVNVQCRGIITTMEKQGVIKNSVYGKILSIKISENAKVNKGDTLIEVDTSEICQSLLLLKSKINIALQEGSDLETLTKLTNTIVFVSLAIHTLKYQQDFQRFISDLRYQKSEIAIISKEFDRQKQLYQNKVIPQSEYDQISYRFENEQLKYTKLFKNQISIWQNENQNLLNQLLTLKESLVNLEKERSKCFIIASSSGYVQNLIAVTVGTLLFPNQDICQLSPNSELVVEMYLSPSDIGMVYLSQKSKFRIDAFNYNSWGMLSGSVIDIANDISIEQNQLQGFRVVCSLPKQSLSYNGKTARLKKGMTLTANLFLMQRTLAELLFDESSQWLNPNITNSGSSKK